MTDEQIGKRIEKLRKGRSLSQADLSAAAGVTAPNLSRIESGVVNPQQIRWVTVDRLSSALGVSADDLMGRESDESDKLSPEPPDTDLVKLTASYQRLSSDRRRQLLEYARFLEAQGRKDKRRKEDQ